MKTLGMQAREAVGKNYGRTHATQTTRALMSSLKQITDYLKSQYGLQRIENLKPGHLQAFFESRIASGLSMSQLQKDAIAARVLCESIGKQNIMPRTNSALGIERTSSDRYQPIDANTDGLATVRDVLSERAAETGNPADKAMVAAVDLRHEFGVRANESLMSRVVERPDGSIFLKVEGTKGGRPRELEARTDTQHVALQNYRETSKEIGNAHGRCIPQSMSARQMYDYQKNHYPGDKEHGTNMHAQRHEYAQERAGSGATDKDVASELGHEREEVVQHYVK